MAGAKGPLQRLEERERTACERILGAEERRGCTRVPVPGGGLDGSDRQKHGKIRTHDVAAIHKPRSSRWSHLPNEREKTGKPSTAAGSTKTRATARDKVQSAQRAYGEDRESGQTSAYKKTWKNFLTIRTPICGESHTKGSKKAAVHSTNKTAGIAYFELQTNDT